MSKSRKKVFYILLLDKVQNPQKDNEGKGKKIKIKKRRRKEKKKLFFKWYIQNFKRNKLLINKEFEVIFFIYINSSVVNKILCLSNNNIFNTYFYNT